MDRVNFSQIPERPSASSYLRRASQDVAPTQLHAEQNRSASWSSPIAPTHLATPDTATQSHVQQLRNTASLSQMVASRRALQSLQSVSMDELADHEKTCDICYNEFGVESVEGINEAPLRLPKCKHIFGDHCIKRWFEDSDVCPYCRDKVQSEPKSHQNTSRAFLNIMRLRGTALPGGLPNHFYSRILELASSDMDLIDALVQSERAADRRSPPDDDTGPDQRRTRQRRSTRAPRRPQFATAQESRPTLPMPDMQPHRHPLSVFIPSDVNPHHDDGRFVEPYQESFPERIQLRNAVGLTPAAQVMHSPLPARGGSVYSTAWSNDSDWTGMSSFGDTSSNAFEPPARMAMLPSHSAMPVPVAGAVDHGASRGMSSQYTGQASEVGAHFGNVRMPNPLFRFSESQARHAGLHIPNLRPMRTTDNYPVSQTTWPTQTGAARDAGQAPGNRRTVHTVSADSYRARPW